MVPWGFVSSAPRAVAKWTPYLATSPQNIARTSHQRLPAHDRHAVVAGHRTWSGSFPRATIDHGGRSTCRFGRATARRRAQLNLGAGSTTRNTAVAAAWPLSRAACWRARAFVTRRDGRSPPVARAVLVRRGMNAKTNNVRRVFVAVLVTGLGAAACGEDDGGNSDAADDTVFEASREQRIDNLAEAACDRYADTGNGCPGFGGDRPYADEDQCENEFRDNAEQLWPVARCNDRQIDNDAYQVCLERSKDYACAQGLGRVVDALEAVAECSADRVCTDAAD